MSKLTPEQLEQAATLRKVKVSPEKIAKSLNVPFNQVIFALLDLGLMQGKREPRNNSLSDFAKKRIKELADKHTPIEEIMLELGTVHRKQVRDVIKRHSPELLRQHYTERIGPPPETVRALVEMRSQRVTLKEMAERLSLTTNIVFKLVKKHCPDSVKPRKPMTESVRGEILRLYVEEKYKAEVIAAMLDLGKSSVYTIICAHNKAQRNAKRIVKAAIEGPKFLFKPAIKAKVLQMYHDDYLSAKDIAKDLDISKQQVDYIIKESKYGC